MKNKTVIFDLDGTLVDTIADLGTAVNFALASKGLPGHEPDEYRGMVGHGVRNLIQLSLPENLRDDNSTVEQLLGIFLDYYTEHIDVHSRAYPGIPQLLTDLHEAGVKIAIASNKFQKGAEKLVRSLFPQIPFAAVCGAQSGMPLKPDPAVVSGILEKSGGCAEDAVLVGDSGTDIATAAAAGIRSIAVSWGFRPKESLKDADCIVDSADELRALLLPSDASAAVN